MHVNARVKLRNVMNCTVPSFLDWTPCSSNNEKICQSEKRKVRVYRFNLVVFLLGNISAVISLTSTWSCTEIWQ